MSDQLDELHAQAVLSLLGAALGAIVPPIPVYDGVVPNPTPPPPYVLVYASIGRPYGTSGLGNALVMTSPTIAARFKCKCVGLSPAAARAVGMQVRSALLDQRPTIAGRNCGPIHEDNEPGPPDRDESLGQVLMVQDLDYVFYSTG
jgi:hypothetical protein